MQITREEFNRFTEYGKKNWQYHIDMIHEYNLEWEKGTFGNWWDGIDFHVDTLNDIVENFRAGH